MRSFFKDLKEVYKLIPLYIEAWLITATVKMSRQRLLVVAQGKGARSFKRLRYRIIHPLNDQVMYTTSPDISFRAWQSNAYESDKVDERGWADNRLADSCFSNEAMGLFHNIFSMLQYDAFCGLEKEIYTEKEIEKGFYVWE